MNLFILSQILAVKNLLDFILRIKVIKLELDIISETKNIFE